MKNYFKEFLTLVLVFSLVGCGGTSSLPTPKSTTVTDTLSSPSIVNPLKIVGQIGGLTKAIATEGNYAYVGVGYRLIILDVTDPSNPQEIGASQPFEGQILDIAVTENYAYLSTGKSGLYIVNISDPYQPTLVGQYDTPGYSEGVLVQKDNVFIADGPGGMSIINISDPAKPILESVSYTKNYIYDIVLDQSFAYLAAAGAGLLVADILDLSHPIEAGSFNTPGYAYGITSKGSILYIADGWEGLQVLDVSNPGQPKDIGAIQTPGWAMDLTITNNSLYIADAFGGLCVLDISNKETPNKIGSLEIPDGHAAKVAMNGNVIYLADTKSGVHIIDVSKQGQPIIVSSYNPIGYVQAVTVADGYAYAAAQNSGFRVINVMDPTRPREVATIPLAGPAVSIAQSGTAAYVADYEFLNTIDVTDPSQPKVTSSERMKGTKNIDLLNSGSFLSDEIVYLVSRSLTIQGKALFLAGEWGLLSLDITDPLSPQELGFLQTTDSPYSQQEPVAIGVAVNENTAYLAVCGAGLYLVDISIPDHPTLISVFNEPMPMAYGKMNSSINVMDVVVAPPYAYILDQNAVRIIDISDSKNPKGIGIYALPTMPFNNGGGASRSLAIEGSKLFVVDNAAGLLVLDVIDPTAPKLDSELHLPGIASWVFVENEYIYVAGGEGGLFIIQYSPDSSGTSENSLAAGNPVIDKTGITSPIIQTKTVKSIFTPYEEACLPVNNSIATGKTIIVNSVSDNGTGTLRESLERVNTGDIITFDPQVFPPENPASIRINSQLPTISKDGITIDASNAGVILDGSDAPSGTAGLSIGSNNNAIMGLQILNFLSDGIKLSGSSNSIGGDRERGNGLMGEGNLVSGNRDFGISICCGENAVNNKIIGNYIGTDVTGTKALANGVGIVIGGWNNTIGGETPAERNVISGNYNADIELKGAAENLIIGNYIGLDKNGSNQISKSAGFSFSVWLKSYNNRIERNVIAGTLGFVDPGTSYNEVVGNYFGTDATGLVSLDSDAYVVVSQPFNRIGGTNPGEGNLINGRISIARTSNTLVLGNSINTDLSGKNVFPRTGGWEVGLTEGSCYNFIGGTTEAERNVINGGQESVLVHLETYSNFNFIAGNSIGSDSSGTIVFPNQTGIAVEDAEFNFIQGNLIEGGINGISLSLSDYEKPGANFNTIKMNDIVQNSKFGIGIGKGDVNIVVGNFFTKNGNNAYDLGDNNNWDDEILGNQWSDYSGEDVNADGVGDTPYIIPNNGIDNYPIMNLSK